MWDFMKKPKPLKPVCQMQPTHEAIKQLEDYRRYVLASLECYYKKILEELSVTDPESLATLNTVINEYKEIEGSIDAKLKQVEEMINTLIFDSVEAVVDGVILHPVYDADSKNLSYEIRKKV